MKCFDCDQLIEHETEMFVICGGKCKNSFHADCIGLSELKARVCLHTKNILWFCDICLDHHEDIKDSEPTIYNGTHNIQKDICCMKDQIANILQKLELNPPQQKSIAPHYSTPISTPKLLEGTREDCSYSNVSTPVLSVSQNCQGKFSLYLTNIEANVTEDQVRSMVSSSLNICHSEELFVFKLLPKWKDRRFIDYASFKVLLDERWKSRAMHPTTWPRGVKFREFINRNDETWKPAVNL